jgi:purine-cytosine permease-like protein
MPSVTGPASDGGSTTPTLVPPSIAPVPPERRTLSAPDVGVLWNDLSLGLLVLVTGALLVPALGLPAAIGAIVVGSLIGCVPLAAVALAGAREGLPGMVLFRPVLGRTGSYLPSVLNVAQLLGWTSVEFWAMGRLANTMSIELFGLDAFWLWLAATAVVCTALAGVLILGLLIGEVPNAFANIYSTAVSTLNVVPRASAALLSVVVGGIGFLLALLLTIDRYEVFLFLIGSVFVPLGAVFLADYFVKARGRYGPELVFGPDSDGFRRSALVPWIVGFVLYHWSVPTGPEGWVEAVGRLFTNVGLPFPLMSSRLGASLPSFAVAFVLSLVVLPRRGKTMVG